jgi:hypothetical protein
MLMLSIKAQSIVPVGRGLSTCLRKMRVKINKDLVQNFVATTSENIK